MKQIPDKIKHILDIILNYLKSILIAIFGGIFKIFSNDNSNKELKSIKLDKNNIDLMKEVNPTDLSGFHNENPETLVLNKDSSFSINIETIEKIILTIFCEELEIEEKDLTNKEKEYIITINKKIVPIINKDITMNSISNENEVKKEIKRLVKKELEYQFSLEQSNRLPADKIVILPLLVDRKTPPKRNVNSNEPTFLEIKAKELNIEFISDVDNSISNDDINNYSNSVTEDATDKTDDIENLSDDIPNLEQDSIEILDTDDSSSVDTLDDVSEEDNSLNYVKEINNDLESNMEVLDNRSTTQSVIKSNNNLAQSSIHIQIMEETLKDLKEPLKEEIIQKQEEFENYDFKNLDNLLEKVAYTYNEEVKKEELEDKNYDLLESLIQDLLERIEKLKLKNLNPLARERLINREKSLLTLKDNLNNQKQKDINKEEAILDEAILTKDLKALELELQKLHIEEKIELQEYMINSLEELETISQEKAKLIEKELLKLRLRKAIHALEVPSFLALPFIRNKYFLYFTCGLFANRHLKLFDAVLKRKTLEYEPVDIAHIKSGSQALEDAMLISNQNIEYLSYLEQDAFRKHPELRMDISYLSSLNKLKSKLLKNQERLLKKEKMIKKHNLKIKKKIRKLKKHEKKNQN